MEKELKTYLEGARKGIEKDGKVVGAVINGQGVVEIQYKTPRGKGALHLVAMGASEHEVKKALGLK